MKPVYGDGKKIPLTSTVSPGANDLTNSPLTWMVKDLGIWPTGTC